MKRLLLSAVFSLAGAFGAQAEPASKVFPEYAQFGEEGKKFLDGIDIKTGTVTVGDGVTIKIADGFYFLDAADADSVLVEAWGNPPGEGTLGMIFPKKYTPLSDGSWGIELTYDDSGHVDDADAATIDYGALLKEMQADTEASNEERVKGGYEPVTLVGWAAPPKYDFEHKRLHWAKELKFGNNESNTLNYNVRVLGREGVFVMNYIADVKDLPEISGSIDSVMNMVSFNDGKRYADFQPGIDKVAAFGIGGLIAGKALMKTGFLAVALVFLKKFGVLLLLPLGWLYRKIRGTKA